MSGSQFRLQNAPIVEAVLDIECHLPPTQEIAALEEAARTCFRDRYPNFGVRHLQEHQIETKPNEPPTLAVRRGVQAFVFEQADGKQLVQVRAQGFSFNRLAPYTTLDEYLPEIERCWRQYLGLASPIQMRLIRLRYINRILLPSVNERIRLDDYFKVAPRLPDEKRLTLVGFLNQHAAMEVDTGHEVNIVLTAQKPEGNRLPVIFDISAAAAESGEPEDWPWIAAKIQALRELKNRIFRESLTETCLNLFRHP